MENNKTPDLSKDFEMNIEKQPQINSYTKEEPANVKYETKNVNPSEPANFPEQNTGTIIRTQATGNGQSVKARPADNAVLQQVAGEKITIVPDAQAAGKAKKRFFLGCVGAFYGIVLLLIVISFIFVSGDPQKDSLLANILGVTQSSLINGLITFIHILFILIALSFFVIAMIYLVKLVTAKKEDPLAKKSALKKCIISASAMILVVIIWFIAFIYLDGLKVKNQTPVVKDPIVTEPTETINLTAPVTIRFDASNVQVDRDKYKIISYKWNFGDGKTATNMITTHTYDNKGATGRFDVVLEVAMIDLITGAESKTTATKIITIANESIIATFDAIPMEGDAPLEVSFDASKSVDPDGELNSIEWDLDGDGEFDDGDEAKFDHTYEKVGIYNVSLRVTSDSGEYDVEEKTISVSAKEAVNAVITMNGEVDKFYVGTEYIFKAEESTSPAGKIIQYEWDFGDGSPTVGTKTASHEYDKESKFTITLTVTDEEGNEGQVKKVVEILPAPGKPVAIITTDPAYKSGETLKGKVPFTVVFDATKSTDIDNNIVEYEWDFNGDSKIDSYEKVVSYTFEDIGSKNVNLKIVDADNNISKASMVVKSEAQGIVAKLTADQVDGTVPLVVEFDASGSTYPEGKITSYKWNFGDKTSPKLGAATISHKFTAIGTYTTSVEVIGADNTKKTASIMITVREIPLTSCFTTTEKEGTAPHTVTFDPGCSTGTIANYFWEFGDGATDTSVKPNHTFTTPGEYKVTLEVSDSENTVDKTDTMIKVTEAPTVPPSGIVIQ